MIPQSALQSPGRRVTSLTLSSSREGDPGGGKAGGKRPAKKAAKKAVKKPVKKSGR